MDGGAQLNLIDVRLAKEADLKIDPVANVVAEAANGSAINLYGMTEAQVTITDSRGREQVHDVALVVADLPRQQIYLGLPWIDSCDPTISYLSRRLFFRGVKYTGGNKRCPVAIEEAEEFDRTMRNPKVEVYACSVSSVGVIGPERANEAQMPPQYADLADAGSVDDAGGLPDHGPQDLAIDVKEGEVPPCKPLYNLSAAELEVLRKYIADYLKRGWIRASKSPAGAPILFAKKKDGTLRLCVDYRGLNKITIKNRHPLPLISESLDRLAKAKWYTKLDVRDAYHRLRIKAGDEWKTAFRTRYGHYEYTVMPFGLTNAPAQFQAYINQALQGLVDITCVVYLDDILVFSDSEEEHTEHVREVLRRLREAKLFVKLSKCEWHKRETEFLGYIITPYGVQVDPDRVKTIQSWPMPRSVRDIRVFIGFMNYYRRFIRGFSRIALPLTRLTAKEPGAAKGGHAQRREESQPLLLNQEAVAAFEQLKGAFLGVPILAHFAQDGRKTKVEVDASGGAISGILSQLVPTRDGKSQWRPIDFFSRKLSSTEFRYDTHDKELLAIVESLEHWRQYLLGTTFDLFTDHNNLRWFMETKVLNQRHVRSYEKLTKFDFTITHRPGKINPADGPSRRPDYMAATQEPAQKYNQAFIQPIQDLFQTRATVAVHSVTTRQQRMAETNKERLLAVEQARQLGKTIPEEEEAIMVPEESCTSETDTSDESGAEETRHEPKQGATRQNDPRRPRTVEEKAAILKTYHDDPMGGHFGSRKTLEKIRRKFDWPGITKDVGDYCKDCLHCKRSTAPRHKPHGLIQPLSPPKDAWEEVTMDFITELPTVEYRGQHFDAILVICCRLTKMAHYVPARSDWKGEDLAKAWIHEVIRLHGAPRRIISDRGPIMNSKIWRTFNYYLDSKRVLTSAYHPETDGQTERQNQTLEQYLRCYCTLEQDNWAELLPIAEFAYNDSVHGTTGYTPFQANHGRHPVGPDWPNEPLSEGECPTGKEKAAKILQIQAECRKQIQKVNDYQRKYADKKRMHHNFQVGDKVLVSNRHMKSIRPKKKLDWKYLGPGTITGQYGPTAFKVDLPGVRNVHPVYHASLLEPYDLSSQIPSQGGQITDTMRDMGDDVYKVDKIVERRRDNHGQWEYLIKWKDYPQEENSWEPGTNLGNETLAKFYKDNFKGPRKRQHG